MSYQVLARKWRPKRFADLVGQEHVLRALTNALSEQRLHHAYLLTGTRGVGKTTIARILAKSLNCESGTSVEPCGECSACLQIDAGRFVDLLEIDAASNTGIDNIREVLENAQYAPTAGRFKVYIIDEVHMLSKSAFNAMLKTLEEPPAHVKFILATTDPQKVPVTVLSRCLQFSLRNMTPQQIREHLAHVLTVEQVPHEPAALGLLGRAAAGSMRDALSLLDQAIAYGMGEVKEEGVRAMLGAVDKRYLYSLLQALAQGDGPQLMAEADQLAERGMDFDSILNELALLLQQLALAQTVPQALVSDDGEQDTLLALAEQIAPPDVQLYYQIAIHGRKDLAIAPDEQAGFNMTLLRMLAFHPVNSHNPPNTAQTNRPAPVVAARPKPSSVSSPASQALQAAGLSAVRNVATPATPPAPLAVDLTAQEVSPPPEPPAPPPTPEPAPAVIETVAVDSSPSPQQDTPPWQTEAEEISAKEPESEPELADDTLAIGVTELDEVPSALLDDLDSSNVQVDYQFDGDWPALLTVLGGKLGAARMLAHNAVLKSWSQDQLTLAVPESFSHMSGRDYQEKLKSALSELFGRELSLSVVIEELGQETPAMQDARHRKEQLEEARTVLKNDPGVQQLVKDFGATLLLETVQPVLVGQA